MQRDRMDWIWFGGLWVLFTAIGEVLALGLNLLPGQYAEEAKVVDDAYVLLIALSVPVFALVAAVLLTAMLRFRTRVGPDGPTEDGPHIAYNKRVVRGWFIGSISLVLLVVINPGLVGLSEIRGESSADMVVEVTSQRWLWTFGFENGAETTTELVLPVDKRVRFDITSLDVVHSFWVPAFRTKIDAVPGRVTELFVTPNREAEPEEDVANLRVQCAEVCGLGHARMGVPIRIVPEAEFDAWVANLAEGE